MKTALQTAIENLEKSKSFTHLDIKLTLRSYHDEEISFSRLVEIFNKKAIEVQKQLLESLLPMEKEQLTFDFIEKKILESNAKSEYMQASILIVRKIFNETFKPE